MAEAERSAISAGLLHVFHRAGFRRVARTNWLALAFKDPSHPSHHLQESNDPTSFDMDEASFDALPPGDRERRFPFHSAMVNMDTEGALAYIQANLASIHQKDDLNCTPLHVAAEIVCNNRGDTPISLLEQHMRGDRDFATALVRFCWTGHSDETCQTLMALKLAAGQQVPPPSDPSMPAWSVFKYDCSCGQCSSGWLSPRMHKRLYICADTAASLVRDALSFQEVVPRRPLPPGFVEYELPMGEFIPLDIRGGEVFQSYIKGYAEVFDAIASVLKKREKLTLQSILERTSSQYRESQYVGFYLSKGGLVEHALNAVIHNATGMNLIT
eukprot:TRINITY_DN5376_c0_g1_i5.p1 TRINITY_DN5376_c0_g1~~TRINITY_DN5376_c0_g1_i5.p1  ORF type:complete len:328 (+),score=36.95 TRINITY_DN5376_c0_g1_i5:668-1651(+)